MSFENKHGLDILNKFLEIGNKSLLIKGKSGTGKETLCFELAANSLKDFNINFITRNQNEKILHRRYPWVKSFLSSSGIIEVSGQEAISTDPSFLISGIVNSISSTVAQVDDPFVSSTELKKPFIILDIWDSVSRELDPKTRMHAEKLLTSLVEKYNGFIVFLSEQPDTSSLEYLVDGVVRTTQQYIEKYRVREVILEKLKGTPIERPKIPFTLKGGRFTAFRSLSHKMTEPKKFSSIENSEKMYSTGNKIFDEKLGGGYKRGSVICIEIEERVDRFAFVPLLTPTVLNFISQNNPALLSSSPDQDVSAVINYLSPHVDNKKLEDNFRIFAHAFGKPSKVVIEREGLDFATAHKKWIETYKKLKEKNKPVLVQVDYSFIELAYQSEFNDILKVLIENSRTIRHNKDLLIITSRPGYKSLEVMKSVCDIHFKIFDYEGTVFLSAQKPQLFLCNLQMDYKFGYPQLNLQESI